MEEYSITQVMDAIKRGWSRETSYTPDEWSEDNRARGQCIISALIINDYFGGAFQRFEIAFDEVREKHYVNVMPDGVVIDVSGMQYQWDVKRTPAPLSTTDVAAIREKLLSDQLTAERYDMLKKRVRHFLRESKLD